MSEEGQLFDRVLFVLYQHLQTLPIHLSFWEMLLIVNVINETKSLLYIHFVSSTCRDCTSSGNLSWWPWRCNVVNDETNFKKEVRKYTFQSTKSNWDSGCEFFFLTLFLILCLLYAYTAGAVAWNFGFLTAIPLSLYFSLEHLHT